MITALILTIALALPATAQDISVINYASGAALIAPEALARVRGHFVDETATASIVRPPRSLAGVQVLIDGIPAQTRSVDPEQIIIIVPRRSPRSASNPVASVRIISPLGEFWALANYAPTAPGLFIRNSERPDDPWAAGFYWRGYEIPRSINKDAIPLNNERLCFQLFGTGFRFASDVRVTVAGLQAQVLGFDKYPNFQGFDSIVFVLPDGVQPNPDGTVKIVISSDSISSNGVLVRLAISAGEQAIVR